MALKPAQRFADVLVGDVSPLCSQHTFVCCLCVRDVIASRARLREEAGASALGWRRGCDFAGGRGLVTWLDTNLIYAAGQ